MLTAFQKAFALLLSGDAALWGVVGVTLRMSLCSSVAALLLGAPLGVFLAMARFRGRGAWVVLNRTLMGMPPVVMGLLLYMLFSGVGPLGKWRMLYTVPAMIIAQILLIVPIVAGSMESFVSALSDAVRETAQGLGLGRGKTYLLACNEAKYHLFTTYLLGFSRAIAEVGAVAMVGGAIAYKTNVMTTAIMNYTNMGDFTTGLALGILLLAMALLVNVALTLVQRRVAR